MRITHKTSRALANDLKHALDRLPHDPVYERALKRGKAMNQKITKIGKFQIGSWVRLTQETCRARKIRGNRSTAQIAAFYPDIPGGVRLDTKLDGFYSWNVKDLELVRVRNRELAR
jgi:hypothetical protein